MTVALWIITAWVAASIVLVGGGVWWLNRPAKPIRGGYVIGGPATRLREDDQ